MLIIVFIKLCVIMLLFHIFIWINIEDHSEKNIVKLLKTVK